MISKEVLIIAAFLIISLHNNHTAKKNSNKNTTYTYLNAIIFHNHPNVKIISYQLML